MPGDRQARRRRSTRAAVMLLAVGLAACRGEPPGADPNALIEGAAIYQAECAACHGRSREGQPDWRTRRPDGKLPAPPHDASGHTWHHPPEQLFAIVKFGLVPPNAPPNYASDMPAFGARLSDAQIRNVLAFIEQQWPPEIRAERAKRLQKQ